MEIFHELGTFNLVLLIICLLAVCGFEFINGFHDTANAVATVIYTKSLKPIYAVVLSGTLNFVGVYVGGIGVAMGIIKLMPLGDMAAQSVANSIALVLCILVAAIIWNLFTWYIGIPCSSSHTLFGSLVGAGLAFQHFHGGAGPNWQKAIEICLSLIGSPLFGFAAVILLMILLRLVFKNKVLFQEPSENAEPPLWIRFILIGTCSAVSWAHGSNDGQKGVGLVMIILMTFMPLQFALNANKDLSAATASLNKIEVVYTKVAAANPDIKDFQTINAQIAQAKQDIAVVNNQDVKSKFKIRKDLQDIGKSYEKLDKEKDLRIPAADKKLVSAEMKDLKEFTEYKIIWVILMIAISLGLGTMVGWKRIVVTIGEKIGKTHLTYAQGAAAELVAASTIAISTYLKLPVSTTHVLSSGIAGSMVAAKGVKNLQRSTIVNIGIAWILTLPVTILLSSALYFIVHIIFF
jgi:PiT family inorganic phosphate transporter